MLISCKRDGRNILLYDNNNKSQEECIHSETDTEEDMKGPRIIYSQFEAALSQLKNEKAEGIPAELPKAIKQ